MREFRAGGNTRVEFDSGRFVGCRMINLLIQGLTSGTFDFQILILSFLMKIRFKNELRLKKIKIAKSSKRTCALL